MRDVRETILVFLFIIISSASAIPRDDVEVFNPNYNRRQLNARNLIYRVYEVIPPRVSAILDTEF